METKTSFKTSTRWPRVKICGLTSKRQALACADLGANAIGCVFYPKSPRNVSRDQARKICTALPDHVVPVGVFVNPAFDFVMDKVNACGIRAAQLHGSESPDLVDRLISEGVRVIKALFEGGTPAMADAGQYSASAFLVECAKGDLPGGNAMAWNWSAARTFGLSHPLILAGGLSPANIGDAINACLPLAIDISSGVESAPGQKDMDKVKKLMDAVLHGTAPYFLHTAPGPFVF